MKPSLKISLPQLFLFICAIYIAGFFAHAFYLKKTVYGDGVYYYAWLRSIVVDHNINFVNEYAELGGTQPTTPLGYAGNKYSVGPAILWSPAFIAVHTLLRGSGYELPYQLAVGLTSVGFTLIGLLLLWKLLKKYFGKMVSFMAVVAIAGTTNILFYGSLDVVNSHALTFFAGTLFLSFVLLHNKKDWYAIGGSLGLVALIRPQDLLYGLLLLPSFWQASHRVRLPAQAGPESQPDAGQASMTNIYKIIAGFSIVFSPQLVAWQLLYGQFWISPYLSGNEGFHFLQPQVVGVLFGLQNGLYLWTPMTLLGTVGLILDTKNRIPHPRIMTLIFLFALYLISTWSTWWQGASYSGRMFVSSLPILAFGIASVFSWLAKYKWTKMYYLVAITIPLSLINAVSIIYFLLRVK